jgi:hypothetical protein
MRTEVIDYLVNAPLQSYNFSRELPFQEGGTALYLKNPKTIYVDTVNKNVQQLFATLQGHSIHVETQTVTVYFSNDAKNPPANYDDLIEYLVKGKDIEPNRGFNDTSVDIRVEIQGDLSVTTVEYQFTKLR